MFSKFLDSTRRLLSRSPSYTAPSAEHEQESEETVEGERVDELEQGGEMVTTRRQQQAEHSELVEGLESNYPTPDRKRKSPQEIGKKVQDNSETKKRRLSEEPGPNQDYWEKLSTLKPQASSSHPNAQKPEESTSGENEEVQKLVIRPHDNTELMVEQSAEKEEDSELDMFAPEDGPDQEEALSSTQQSASAIFPVSPGTKTFRAVVQVPSSSGTPLDGEENDVKHGRNVDVVEAETQVVSDSVQYPQISKTQPALETAETQDDNVEESAQPTEIAATEEPVLLDTEAVASAPMLYPQLPQVLPATDVHKEEGEEAEEAGYKARKSPSVAIDEDLVQPAAVREKSVSTEPTAPNTTDAFDLVKHLARPAVIDKPKIQQKEEQNDQTTSVMNSAVPAPEQAQSDAKHKRFGSEDPVEVDAATVPEPVLAIADSDDEAPETITAAVGQGQARAAAAEAEKAAKRQAEVGKEKRRKIDAGLKKQAEAVQKEKAKQAQKALKKAKRQKTLAQKLLEADRLPDELPMEILAAEPSQRKPTPPPKLDTKRPVASKKRKFLDDEEKPPKDVRRGNKTIRVLQKTSLILPPKASKSKTNQLREAWLQGNRGKGSNVEHRVPTKKSFLRK